MLQVVLMALWQREERPPVVLHSDRGCQFTSEEYQRFLKGHRIICSMSATGTVVRITRRRRASLGCSNASV